MNKYIYNFECKLCNEEMTTGYCKTRIGRYIKMILVMQKHVKEKHGMGFWDVVFKL